MLSLVPLPVYRTYGDNASTKSVITSESGSFVMRLMLYPICLMYAMLSADLLLSVVYLYTMHGYSICIPAGGSKYTFRMPWASAKSTNFLWILSLFNPDTPCCKGYSWGIYGNVIDLPFCPPQFQIDREILGSSICRNG